MKIESALIQSFIIFLINASDEISLTYKIQSLASQLWYMTQVKRGVEVTLFLGGRHEEIRSCTSSIWGIKPIYKLREDFLKMRVGQNTFIGSIFFSEEGRNTLKRNDLFLMLDVNYKGQVK